MEIVEVVDALDFKEQKSSVTCIVATLSDARRTGAVLSGLRSHFGDEGPLSYLKRVKSAMGKASGTALPELLVSTTEDFAKLAPRCWEEAQKGGSLNVAPRFFPVSESVGCSTASSKVEEWVAKSLACGDVTRFRVVVLIGRAAATEWLLSDAGGSLPLSFSGAIEEWPLDFVKLAATLPAGLALPRSSGAKAGASAMTSAACKGKAPAPTSLSLRDALDGVRPNPRDVFAPPMPASAFDGPVAEPSDAAYIDTMLKLLQRLEGDAQAAGFRPQACVIACRASDWMRSIEAVLCRAAAADSDEEDGTGRPVSAPSVLAGGAGAGSTAVSAAAQGTSAAAAAGGAGSASAVNDAAPALAMTEEQRSVVLSAVPTDGPFAGIVVRGFAYGRDSASASVDTGPRSDTSCSAAASGAGAPSAAAGSSAHTASDLPLSASSSGPGGLVGHPLHTAVLLAAASAAAADRAARSSVAGAYAIDDGSHPPPPKRPRISTGEGRDAAPLAAAASGRAGTHASASPPVVPLPVTTTHPSAYLCTGADAFLSEEPNFMDAMALVHCRVARVFFKRTKSAVGDQGCLYSAPIRFHTLPGLNHRYRVFHLRSADHVGLPLSHETTGP